MCVFFLGACGTSCTKHTGHHATPPPTCPIADHQRPQAAHPMLKFSKDLQLFLEASEEEWSLEVSRAIAEANAQKPKFSGMAQIFKGLQHSTANLVAGRTDDEDEDPEYLKVRAVVCMYVGMGM